MKKFFTLFLLVLFILLLQNSFAQSPEWINYTTDNSLLPSNHLNHITVDNNNRKWMVTDCNGLVMIDDSGWHIFNTTNSSIPSDCISCIASDNNQNLWLGGWNDNFQLAKYDGSNWSVWGANKSPLVYNYVNSITFDSTNKIWLQSSNPVNFGTANHLFSFDGDSTWNNELSFTSMDGWRKVLVSGDSVIIAATDYNGKLIVLKSDGSHYEIEEFVGTYVTDLKEDFSGNIWIAAGLAGWGYLYKYDGTSFTAFPQYSATAIEVDDENNIWFGAVFGIDDTLRLVKYDGTDWTEYTAENSPLPRVGSITDLSFDQIGNLWITTDINGVYIFNENGITPVELTSFSANVSDNNVTLNWITESETNNQRFDIERRQNEEWKKIGFVEGNGTTTEQQFYSYTDRNLTSGKYQYRLKQIDLDGSFEYSNVIEAEIGLPLEFSLYQNYPNPFNPTTTIKFSIPEKGSRSPLERGLRGVLTKLIIYDILGREITTLVNEEKQPGIYEVKFNAFGLPSGIYFYKLSAGNYNSVKKLILLK